MNFKNNKTIETLKELSLFCSKEDLIKANNRLTTTEKLKQDIIKFNSNNFKSLN